MFDICDILQIKFRHWNVSKKWRKISAQLILYATAIRLHKYCEMLERIIHILVPNLLCYTKNY